MKDVCEVTCVNDEAVAQVKAQMPELTAVSKLLKVLSDETRLKILYALTIEQRLCVCDVATIIGKYCNDLSPFTKFERERLGKIDA